MADAAATAAYTSKAMEIISAITSNRRIAVACLRKNVLIFVARKDYEIFTGTLEQAEAFVNSINNKRRHMSSAMIQAYLTKVIQRYPRMKDREIERMTGHSHVTVGKTRYKLVNPDMIDARTLKEFDEFKKKFAQKWPEYLRVQFVRYFENDILTKALKGEGNLLAWRLLQWPKAHKQRIADWGLNDYLGHNPTGGRRWRKNPRL